MSERANVQDRGRRIESRLVSERKEVKGEKKIEEEEEGKRQTEKAEAAGIHNDGQVYGARDDLRDDS